MNEHQLRHRMVTLDPDGRPVPPPLPLVGLSIMFLVTIAVLTCILWALPLIAPPLPVPLTPVKSDPAVVCTLHVAAKWHPRKPEYWAAKDACIWAFNEERGVR